MNKLDIQSTTTSMVTQVFNLANVPTEIREEVSPLCEKYVESELNELLLKKIFDGPKLDNILEAFSDAEFLTADGFDDAIIGVDETTMRLIYSVSRCIEILVDQGMSIEDAYEHFEYNVSGSYVGKRTPIWCYDTF